MPSDPRLRQGRRRAPRDDDAQRLPDRRQTSEENVRRISAKLRSASGPGNNATECVTEFDKWSEMITFESILTTFEASVILRQLWQ